MPITVKFTSDTKDLESGGKRVEQSYDAIAQSLKGIEEAAKRTADATENLAIGAGVATATADSFGNLERVLLGVSDNMSVMAEQFGISLGPAQEWVAAGAGVAGGMEAVIAGAMGLIESLPKMVTSMVPVIASTWAHVTALTAQAAAFIVANAPIIAMIAAIALLAAGVVLLVQHWDTIVQKVPALGVAFDAVKTAIQAVVDWITQSFVPGFEKLYTAAADVVGRVVAFITDHFPPIWTGIIEPTLKILWEGVELYFGLVKTFIDTTFGVIRGLFDVFAGLFTGDWDRVWKGVREIVDSLWEGIQKAFKLGLQALRDIIPEFLTIGQNFGGFLWEGMKWGLNGMLAAVESGLNWVLGAAAGALRKIKGLMDKVPGANPFGDALNAAIGALDSGVSLPRLAEGGIVNGPTAAIVGEDGPEAVVPLSKRNILTDFLQRIEEGLYAGGESLTTWVIRIQEWTEGMADMRFEIRDRLDAIAGKLGAVVTNTDRSAVLPISPSGNVSGRRDASTGGNNEPDGMAGGRTIGGGAPQQFMDLLSFLKGVFTTDDGPFVSSGLSVAEYLSRAEDNAEGANDRRHEQRAWEAEMLAVAKEQSVLLRNILARTGISVDTLIDAIDRRRADGWAPA